MEIFGKQTVSSARVASRRVALLRVASRRSAPRREMLWSSRHDLATIGEAHVKLMLNARGQAPAPIDHERLWGPILHADAKSCGAPVGASSVLLRPTNIYVRSVADLLPVELTPMMTDTAASLSRRLSECDFLDPIKTLRKGNGTGGYVTLNDTKYAQARRKSWSVTAGLGTNDTAFGHEQALVPLQCYPHVYRPSVGAYHCTPMPMPVFTLGVEL